MNVITIERTAINRLKAQWPCHNIPDDADLVVAVFADNGDLVDYQISDRADNVIYANCRRTDDARAALSALFDDAKERAINKFPQSNILDNWVYA
tara:strand:+ start:1508 stop:1792 length:285 start_codon:yes stop_codon:yes gene_type:complete